MASHSYSSGGKDRVLPNPARKESVSFNSGLFPSARSNAARRESVSFNSGLLTTKGSRAGSTKNKSDSESSSSSDSDSSVSSDVLDEDSDYDVLEHFRTRATLGKKELIEEATIGDVIQQSLESLRPALGKEVLNVISSRYRDDHLSATDNIWSNARNLLGIELAHIPTNTSKEPKSEPFFRWIHLYKSSMAFDEFTGHVASLPGLTKEDVQEIQWIAGRATKEGMKTTVDQTGRKTSCLEPVMIAKSVSKPSGDEHDYMFFAIPFFILSRYTDSQIDNRGHFIHTLPLMQSRSPSVPKHREMQQAVCQLQGTAPEMCFHVSPLWYFSVRDKYIVTYSMQLTTKDLCGDSIKIRTEIPNNPSSFTAGIMLLEFKGAMYSIPLEQCDSWFKLTAMFFVFTYRFDDEFQVFWKGREIDSTQWGLVMKQTRGKVQHVTVKSREQCIVHAGPSSSAHTNLDGASLNDDSMSQPEPSTTTLDAKPEPKIRDLLQPQAFTSSKYSVNEIPRRVSTSAHILVQAYLEDFHIIQWLAIQSGATQDNSGVGEQVKDSPSAAVPVTQPRSFFDGQVISFLTDLDDALNHQPDREKRVLYQKCPPKLCTEAEKALAGMILANLDKPRVTRIKRELFTACESLFRVFIPCDQQEKICLKFWGSLHRSITGSFEIKLKVAKRTLAVLKDIAKKATRIQYQLSGSRGPDPVQNVLPSDFTKAWYYLLSSLLNMTWTQDAMMRADKYAIKFQASMNKGYEALLGENSGARLRELRVALPVEMIIFLSRRVIEDGPNEYETAEKTAWSYFRQIEVQVSDKPLDRSHHLKISFLLEEIVVLEHHLSKQLEILEKLSNTAAFKPKGRFHDHFHVQTVGALKDSVRGKVDSLQQLRNSANELLRRSKEQIASNKDRQEAAIYVFTIVTIIFLPISTVSSVLGMNTSDVRDMQQSQWLFWAIAIPVTAVTVSASLVGAGVVSLRSRGITPTLEKAQHAPNYSAQYRPPPAHRQFPGWPS